MPSTTLRAYLDDLPPTTQHGHPASAEQQLLRDGGTKHHVINVGLLLLGARRARELSGQARTAFLGKPDILNPEWVARQVEDFIDRPVRDFAVQLVNDMLAQAQRVALAKMQPDASGRLSVFSRVHERNGRFYRTSDEGSADIGLRIVQLVQFAAQFGLVEIADDETAWVTADGRDLLELDA